MFELSYWEYDSVFRDLDVCIIGSGIVGLSAAYYLKKQHPRLKILVVDRGFLPYGASTRNAGFACFGSISELISDLENESEDEVFKRVRLRYEGLKKLRKNLGDKNTGYENLGGYEVFTEDDEKVFNACMNKMNYFNQLMFEITGKKNIYSLKNEKIKQFRFSKVQHLILNSEEGQINTGIMMDALANAVRKLNVRIINGLNINSVHTTANGAELNCDGFKFHSKKILIANNGFARTLLPEIAVAPARAQVLITSPVPGLKVKGTFHYQQGYYYFRNVNDRILLGGGRNLDFKGEETMEFGLTLHIQKSLETMLDEMILPQSKYKIEMRWSGIMGLGKSKSTILKKTSENIFCAVRMGGMGVAIGTTIGEQAAVMVGQSL